MVEPPVSVVMVVRDVDRFLAESIESILRQTLRDFEFVIVDFGSSGKTRDITMSYAVKDNRIRLEQIPDCTLAEARNAACSLAKGRYIAIMDADDVSLPNRLMLEVGFMDTHPEIRLLGGAVEWIDATGRSLWTNYFPAQTQEIQSALTTRCAFCHSAVLMRKDAFTFVGGYRPVFTQTHDYDLWLRFVEHFPCANLSDVVLKYRIHGHQVSLHQRKQQTLCKLAAQASASLRKIGNKDPASSAPEITSQAISAWGVSQAAQQNALASDCQDWIFNLCAAGEEAAALKIAVETIESSDWEYADRLLVGDLHVAVARLLWRRRKYLSGVKAASRALRVRPVVIGRLLRSLLRRLGLVRVLGPGSRPIPTQDHT